LGKLGLPEQQDRSVGVVIMRSRTARMCDISVAVNEKRSMNFE